MPGHVDRPPGKLHVASAWRGREIGANPDRWLTLLDAGDIAELENAAKSYLAATDDIAGITRERFPLPRFGTRLEKLRKELLDGLGFEVIRGLPVATYSQKLAAT